MENLHGVGVNEGGYDNKVRDEPGAKEVEKEELISLVLPRQLPVVVPELHLQQHMRQEEAVNKELNQYFLDLAYAIGRVPNKHAYDAAYAMDSSYVTNKAFLKLFLEADDYNVKNAATRIVCHFECKLDIFGPTKLVKDITQDDLDEDALKC